MTVPEGSTHLTHLGGLGAGSAVRHAWLLTGGKLLVLEVLIYSVVSLQMDPLSLLCVDIFKFFFFKFANKLLSFWGTSKLTV